MSNNAAYHVGKNSAEDTITLSTGVQARIIPVAASLIQDVVSQIKRPKVPMWFNEDKEREEENPLDPDYIQAMEDYQNDCVFSSYDALILFGLELVDGMPENDAWLKKLVWMSKRGRINLSDYDLDDEFDREYLYKRYIACGTVDLVEIGRAAGLSGEVVAEQATRFPDNA